MGVLIRKKNGKWYVFINHNGRRKSKCVGDKTSAEAVARKIRQKLAIGELKIADKQAINFAKYADKWLAYVEKVRTPSTWERYDTVLKKHLLPAFSDRELASITRAEVRDFLLGLLSQGYEKAGISLIEVVLSNIFAYAIDEELISVDPTVGITKRLDLRANDRKVDEAEVFNEEEIELLLDTCREHFRKFHLFFLMGCRTGMRLAELLGVQWNDIDFNSGYITVRRQYRRGRFSLPKTKKFGKVEMSQQLKEALLRAQKIVPMKGRTDLVFHDEGKPWTEETVRKILKKILKKAGLRELNFHSLRHSCASILLSKGASVTYVAQQLRHSNPHITLTVYAHFVKTGKKSEVNLLDTPVCTSTAPSQPEALQT